MSLVVCHGGTHTLRRLRGQVKAADHEPMPAAPADHGPMQEVHKILPINQRINSAKADIMASMAPADSAIGDQANKIIASMVRQAKVQAQLLVEHARKKIAAEERNWIVPFKAPTPGKPGQPGQPAAKPIIIQTPSGPKAVAPPTEKEIQRVIMERKAQDLPPLPRAEIMRMIIETIQAEAMAPPIEEEEEAKKAKNNERPVQDEVAGPGDIVLHDGKGMAAPPIDTDLLTIIPTTGKVTGGLIEVNNTAPPDGPPAEEKEVDIDAPLPLKTVGPIAEGLVDENYIAYSSVYTPKTLNIDGDDMAEAEAMSTEAQKRLVPIRTQIKQTCLGAPCGDEVKETLETNVKYADDVPQLPADF